MIFLIVGEFCVGKDVVADMMFDYVTFDSKYNDFTINKVLSYTTRKPRYPNEPTHLFCSKEYFDTFDDLLATTVIDNEYYGARVSQFDLVAENHIDLYVVDHKGVYDVVNSGISADKIHTIQVIRPQWLRDCPKERLERESQIVPIDYNVAYRIMNDGDMKKLQRETQDCVDFLCKKYL